MIRILLRQLYSRPWPIVSTILTIYPTVQHTKIKRSSNDAFFDDPQTLTYDIIAVQKPWRNSEFSITYHPHRDIFHLIYMGHGSTRVCFYINKRLAISSRNATHHNPDLCTIYLEIHSIGKLHIHNIICIQFGDYRASGKVLEKPMLSFCARPRGHAKRIG